jgi:hypothetical protein
MQFIERKKNGGNVEQDGKATIDMKVSILQDLGGTAHR